MYVPPTLANFAGSTSPLWGATNCASVCTFSPPMVQAAPTVTCSPGVQPTTEKLTGSSTSTSSLSIEIFALIVGPGVLSTKVMSFCEAIGRTGVCRRRWAFVHHRNLNSASGCDLRRASGTVSTKSVETMGSI